MPKKEVYSENRFFHKIFHKYGVGRLDEAVSIIKQLNAKRIPGILAYFPLRKDNAKAVRSDIEEYHRLLDRIQKEKLDCEVALKLHQFGVYGSVSLAEKSVTDIVRYAHKKGLFVWIDMELCETADATINIFKRLHKKYRNVGICLQVYLKRTENDIRALLKNKNVTMRLVKGFYKEHDFKSWADVTKNYSRLMEFLLLHSPRPGIATHDQRLIAKAKRLIKKHRIKNAEFQFYKGVCDDLALKLKKKGFNVRVYVPYGHMFLHTIKGWKTFDMIRQFQRLFGVKNIR